jgi:hypothetical protein
MMKPEVPVFLIFVPSGMAVIGQPTARLHPYPYLCHSFKDIIIIKYSP